MRTRRGGCSQEAVVVRACAYAGLFAAFAHTASWPSYDPDNDLQSTKRLLFQSSPSLMRLSPSAQNPICEFTGVCVWAQNQLNGIIISSMAR